MGPIEAIGGDTEDLVEFLYMNMKKDHLFWIS